LQEHQLFWRTADLCFLCNLVYALAPACVFISNDDHCVVPKYDPKG